MTLSYKVEEILNLLKVVHEKVDTIKTSNSEGSTNKPSVIPTRDGYIHEFEIEKRLERLFQSILEDKKIEAIKEHRCLTGRGLKESKDWVEKLISDLGKKFSKKDDEDDITF